MDNVKKNKKYAIIGIGVGIILLIISTVASMYIPTTYIVEKAYTEEYLVPAYKTVTHNDPIYADKYKTVTHNDPIYEDKYKTVTHRDPEYKTLYTYHLKDIISYWTDDHYYIENVYSLSKTYSGTDSGGRDEYIIHISYYDNLQKVKKDYYDIDYWEKTDQYEVIVGYDIWTEQVLDGQEIVGYDIWTEQVLDGQEITAYNTWTEKVVDKYDTKERIAYKDVNRTCSWFTRTTGIVL